MTRKPLLASIAVLALLAPAIVLIGTARQPAQEAPFAHLIGNHCTAWVASHPGGTYSLRTGGIWTADRGIVAVSGKLQKITGGWAQFIADPRTETWIPLDQIIALQTDSPVRSRPGVHIGGPGIHVLPLDPQDHTND